MARQGLPYSVFSPIVNETPGSAITYGVPVVFDHPIEANVSYERADKPLYGGDVIAESDNSVSGGTLGIGLTTITPAEKAVMLGHTLAGTAPNTYYVESDDPSPYGGYGYVTKEKENGVPKWYGYWIYKTQLAMKADNAKTKADTTDWQTPALEGAIMGVVVDASGKTVFRAYKVFDTYAAAKAWVDTFAGVNATAVATPTATPVTGAVAEETEVTLACETSGAEIHYTTDGSAPSSGSMLYSEPLVVYGPMTIKAIAVKNGMADSAVLTAAYTISA